MKTILIGFGDIAPKYLEVLRELKCEVSGIVTRNYDNALIKAKQFGIKNAYKSLNDISDIDCNFFTILTNPENNQNVLEQIISFKKPILIEKPITFSSHTLNQIIDSNREKLFVMTAMNRRFYSIFHKGLKYLKENDKKINSVFVEAPERFTDINLPKFSEISRKNWMFVNAIHCIDLIRFFGGDVERIQTNTNFHKYSYSAIGHCDKDVDFTYLSNWKSPGSWSVTLYADDVRITYNPLEKGIITENNEKKEIIPDIEDVSFKPGFYSQLKYFIDHVSSQENFQWPASSIVDHAKTLKLVEEIYQVNREK